MRKDRKIKYRGREVSYSVYEDNGQYSATAYVTIHSENNVVDQQINSTKIHSTPEEAEEAIIAGAKQWIDNHLN